MYWTPCSNPFSWQVFKNTQNGYTLLQNITKVQTADWVESTMPLANDGVFKLEFEGIRGDSFQGDIALDDIEVREKYSFIDALGYFSSLLFFFGLIV